MNTFTTCFDEIRHCGGEQKGTSKGVLYPAMNCWSIETTKDPNVGSLPWCDNCAWFDIWSSADANEATKDEHYCTRRHTIVRTLLYLWRYSRGRVRRSQAISMFQKFR